MNLNKFIDNPKEISKEFLRLKGIIEKLISSYSEKNIPTEKNITLNYRGLLKYQQLKNEVDILKCYQSYKDTEILYGILNTLYNNLLENMEKIALNFQSDDYKETLEKIKEELEKYNIIIGKINNFIYPLDGNIILASVLYTKQNIIIFKVLYNSKHESYKFITTMENFRISDLGSLENKMENLSDILDYINKEILFQKIIKNIKESEVLNSSYIRIGFNIASKEILQDFQNILLFYFSNLINKIYVYENDLLVKLRNPLNPESLKDIVRVLGLKNNDIFRMII